MDPAPGYRPQLGTDYRDFHMAPIWNVARGELARQTGVVFCDVKERDSHRLVEVAPEHF